MLFDIRAYDAVSSTMDLARAAAEAGAAEGVVIVADEQTAGRGRRGRAWSSPRGAGLYLSCVLRPPPDEPRLVSLITLAAGVALHEAIERAAAVSVELKWPNDVVLVGRKLAGILAEGLALGSPGQAVVLGVGVNVTWSSHPADVAARAISLEEAAGRAIDRRALQAEVLSAVDRVYARLRRGAADDILRAWRRHAPSADGASVEWHAAGGVQRGTTAGIDGSGALLVRTAHGMERIIGGELRWT